MEAIVVELDKSGESDFNSMQIDDVKSTEQQVVEVTENLIKQTESVIAHVDDVVLDEVEDVPKENVPPEEAVVPEESTDSVIKSNPSSPSSSSRDEPAVSES